MGEPTQGPTMWPGDAQGAVVALLERHGLTTLYQRNRARAEHRERAVWLDRAHATLRELGKRCRAARHFETEYVPQWHAACDEARAECERLRAESEKQTVKARVYGAIACEYGEALQCFADRGEALAQAALDWRHSEGGGVPMKAIEETAGLLEARAECERLRAERDAHLDGYYTMAKHAAESLNERDEARAECERLRVVFDSAQAALDERKAECERLRADNAAAYRALMTGDPADEGGDLATHIKRLRAEREREGVRVIELQADVGRRVQELGRVLAERDTWKRRANAKRVEYINQLGAECERLRAERAHARACYEDERAVAERLRAERDEARMLQHAAEERETCIRQQRNAEYDATELGGVADRLDGDNWATDAATVRAAAATLARLRPIVEARLSPPRWRKGDCDALTPEDRAWARGEDAAPKAAARCGTCRQADDSHDRSRDRWVWCKRGGVRPVGGTTLCERVIREALDLVDEVAGGDRRHTVLELMPRLHQLLRSCASCAYWTFECSKGHLPPGASTLIGDPTRCICGEWKSRIVDGAVVGGKPTDVCESEAGPSNADDSSGLRAAGAEPTTVAVDGPEQVGECAAPRSGAAARLDAVFAEEDAADREMVRRSDCDPRVRCADCRHTDGEIDGEGYVWCEHRGRPSVGGCDHYGARGIVGEPDEELERRVAGSAAGPPQHARPRTPITKRRTPADEWRSCLKRKADEACPDSFDGCEDCCYADKCLQWLATAPSPPVLSSEVAEAVRAWQEAVHDGLRGDEQRARDVLLRLLATANEPREPAPADGWPECVREWRGAWHGTLPHPQLSVVELPHEERCRRNKLSARDLVYDTQRLRDDDGVPYAEKVAADCLQWLATAPSPPVLSSELADAVREAKAWCEDPDDYDGVPHVCALLDAVDGCRTEAEVRDAALEEAVRRDGYYGAGQIIRALKGGDR